MKRYLSTKPVLSDRVKGVEYSETLRVNDRQNELIAQGKDVVKLGFGEADYPCSQQFVDGLAEASREGRSRYTNCAGTLEIRESAAEAWKTYIRTNGFRSPPTGEVYPVYTADEVLAGPGTKSLMFSAMAALCNPEDEVVLHRPYWTYPDMVKISGAKVNVVQSRQEDGFRLTKDLLEDSLTEKSKLLIINSPNNPTGQVFSKKDLKGIIDVAMSHGLFVLSDEIYGLVTYDDVEHHSIASLGDDDFLQQCIVTTGMSKAYSMGGWRLGFAFVKNKELYNAMKNIASNTYTAPASMIQDACVGFANVQDEVVKMREDYSRRRDVIYQGFLRLGFDVLEPKGAFYMFPKVSQHFGKKYKGRPIENSSDFAMALLEEGVGSNPGKPFGSDNHIRICFVEPVERLEEACRRIEKFVNSLD